MTKNTKFFIHNLDVLKKFEVDILKTIELGHLF